MECSGKGLCDRSTGECECFDGYTGKGCQRMTCPNDCSGHGTCEYIEELTHGTTAGHYWSTQSGIYTVAKTFENTMAKVWDNHKAMACVCDAGYIDVDCSRRMCPKANDVMDERLNIADVLLYQKQNITLYAAGDASDGVGSDINEFYGGEFALTFTSTLNESFTTVPLEIVGATDTNAATGSAYGITGVEDQLAEDIRIALQALPNKVVTRVNVECNLGYEVREVDTINQDHAFLNIEVEFVGASVQGPQKFLTVEADKCENGCTPKISGLNLLSTSQEHLVSFVDQKQAADYNNYECGRRGKCDYDKGLCECFEGFTGEACSIQTALV